MFAASRTDPDNPWIVALAESLRRTTGRAPNLVPNSSGGNPSASFAEELGLPVAWVPNGHAGSNQHAPDEHALAPLLREGLAMMAGVWWDIGAGLHPPSLAPCWQSAAHAPCASPLPDPTWRDRRS